MRLDYWIEQLLNLQILSERDLKQVCQQVIEQFMQESNVQPVCAPVNICGDIHGQFLDLIELMKVGGQIPDQSYIFVGDFVDRGYHSVETIEYLILLKLKYPGNITLLRGNHESRMSTQTYGFYDEILRKYGNASPWRLFMEVFDAMPISAVVDGQILCVHGGLSPEIRTIDQIRTIDRQQEIPHIGPFCDIMWSDPDDIEYWATNTRGAGYVFGNRVVDEFNRINGLSLICRAHQLVMEGFLYWFPNQNLITVWSAPNYVYKCGNKASFMKVNENLDREMIMFRESEESIKSTPLKQVLPYFL